MALTFDPDQVHAEAVRLGLIGPNDHLPRHLEARAKQSLASATVAPPRTDPVAAREIVVTGNRRIVIDGKPLDCALPDGIAVDLRDGVSTVTVTLAARHIEIQPQENRA